MWEGEGAREGETGWRTRVWHDRHSPREARQRAKAHTGRTTSREPFSTASRVRGVCVRAWVPVRRPTVDVEEGPCVGVVQRPFGCHEPVQLHRGQHFGSSQRALNNANDCRAGAGVLVRNTAGRGRPWLRGPRRSGRRGFGFSGGRASLRTGRGRHPGGEAERSTVTVRAHEPTVARWGVYEAVSDTLPLAPLCTATHRTPLRAN